MSDIDTVKEQLVEAERDLKTWEETLKKEPYNVLAMDRVYKLTATVYTIKALVAKLQA